MSEKVSQGKQLSDSGPIKIQSGMEVALRYTLLTLFTLFTVDLLSKMWDWIPALDCYDY